jgi:hypothetical protein
MATSFWLDKGGIGVRFPAGNELWKFGIISGYSGLLPRRKRQRIEAARSIPSGDEVKIIQSPKRDVLNKRQNDG